MWELSQNFKITWSRRKKTRKNFHKSMSSYILELVRKVVICGSSHILGINL
ncbi:hypothetical protein LEP1GSC046_1578 [Leptospira kirschneri serovar Bim str. 1051]|nr:hypothetical protein LEP1GSC042_2959 [Leptospira kirschneri serovar Bim str. PUO 1247]EMN03647.1 hypothetical protein LEP1GSC046_1578 [Leptospira kirschneri serovar Bim str. 1051]